MLVITTDARSIGRAEMVVRSVAPTASIQRVPFAIGADAAARRGSLDDVKEAALAGLDAGELVAVAVLGDATQWTIFPDLAELVGAARSGVTVAVEPGITSYQAAAADAVTALGRPAGGLVVVDRVDDLDRHLGDPATTVVLYKATTDAVALKELASRHRARRRRGGRAHRAPGSPPPAAGAERRRPDLLPGHRAVPRPLAAADPRPTVISFVGAGPGAADLITLRGAERLAARRRRRVGRVAGTPRAARALPRRCRDPRLQDR